MQVYIDITMIALITIYIVDLSGFTESWRHLVGRMLGIKALRPLPPFDCGQCMVWWVCLIYSLIVGEFTLLHIAFIALLAFLSVPLGQALMFIKEGMIKVTNKLIDLC